MHGITSCERQAFSLIENYDPRIDSCINFVIHYQHTGKFEIHMQLVHTTMHFIGYITNKLQGRLDVSHCSKTNLLLFEKTVFYLSTRKIAAHSLYIPSITAETDPTRFENVL